MKVLFLQPPWPGEGYGLRSQNRWPRKRGDKANRYPLYMSYTATRLKNAGFDVLYQDSIMQDFAEKESLRNVHNASPDIVFIEPATPTINYDIYYARELKEVMPGLKIIFSGSHVTRFPEEVLNRDAVDAVVRGEQDETTLHLIKAWADGIPLSEIKGIGFRDKEGNPVITEPRPLINDLDTLPFPDRDLIPHQWYKEGHVIRTPFTFIITSRGCPNQCSFCLWPNVFFEHKVRFRSIGNVLEEIDWLVQKYGVKELFIDDGTFNVSKRRALKFCRKLSERNHDLTWSCSCRVDRVDEEMLRLMKKSGCKLICYGPESASQETLDRVKKNIDVSMSKRAVELTKKAGIIAHANFMFGFPWETKKDIETTIQFALDIDPDTVQFSLVFPHPGSEMFDIALKNGWFLGNVIGNWDRFEMSCGPVLRCGVPEEELKRYISRAHARFFFRPSYIIKNLLNVRSKDGFLRLMKGGHSVVKGKILFKGTHEGRSLKGIFPGS